MHVVVNDLYSLDSELHRHLMTLKNYTGDVEREFDLDFTVTDQGRLLLLWQAAVSTRVLLLLLLISLTRDGVCSIWSRQCS
jgi:hypothetical protein